MKQKKKLIEVAFAIPLDAINKASAWEGESLWIH